MNMKTLLTREEFEKHGFIYEPDVTKCKTRKLKLYVPAEEMINDEYRMEIVNQLPYQYIHEVIETPNPYAGNPDYCCDPKVLVRGHTPNGK